MNELKIFNKELAEQSKGLHNIEQVGGRVDLLVDNARNYIENQVKLESTKKDKAGNLIPSPTLKAIKKSPGNFANIIRNYIALGLDLSQKEAYILPFGEEPTAIIDWKGLKKIMIMFSIIPIKDIQAENVYANDTFSYKNGVVEHEFDPLDDENRGEFRGTYAKVIKEDGGVDFHFVSKKEIEKVKSFSKSASTSSSPWKTWPEQMYLKTAIRKAFKNYPLNINAEQQEGLTKGDNDIDFSRPIQATASVKKTPVITVASCPEREALFDYMDANELVYEAIGEEYGLSKETEPERFKEVLEDLELKKLLNSKNKEVLGVE